MIKQPNCSREQSICIAVKNKMHFLKKKMNRYQAIGCLDIDQWGELLDWGISVDMIAWKIHKQQNMKKKKIRKKKKIIQTWTFTLQPCEAVYEFCMLPRVRGQRS